MDAPFFKGSFNPNSSPEGGQGCREPVEPVGEGLKKWMWYEFCSFSYKRSILEILFIIPFLSYIFHD